MSTRPDAVIVDMDGTLVNVESIRHHVRGTLLPDGSYSRKNFRAFHEESVNCPAIPRTVAYVEQFRRFGIKIIIVTARSQEFMHHTNWWLALNGIEVDDLYMRTTGDFRPDYEVKKDLLWLIRRRWTPVHAIDDNPNVLRLWDEEGIPTTRIPGWEE